MKFIDMCYEGSHIASAGIYLLLITSSSSRPPRALNVAAVSGGDDVVLDSSLPEVVRARKKLQKWFQGPLE